MLKINFYPSHSLPEYIKAAKEYQNIWNSEGEKIIRSFKKVTGLDPKSTFINVLIFEGISMSYPMVLRPSYSEEIKKSTLVHELAHRYLQNIDRTHIHKELKDSHKQLNLILFDVWVDVYGEDFAKRNVDNESKLKEGYKKAWDWALSFTKEERQEKFKKLVQEVPKE